MVEIIDSNSFYFIRTIMQLRTGKSLINFITSGLLSIFTFKRLRHTKEDLKKVEFGTSTQRLGIQFKEKIRDIFRFRWIRKQNYRN